MMSTWRFRDFVNDRGENVIRSWLDSLPKAAKAKAKAEINALILVLKEKDVDSFTRADKVGLLRGPCSGLIELIIEVNGVQYRPIGWYGPDRKEITLLAGAKEKDNQLIPSSTCDTALERQSLVQADKRRYSCDHDFR